MGCNLMKLFLSIGWLILASQAFSQSQTCPPNVDFSAHALTHWWAYTGNNQDGNGPGAIRVNYDSTQTAANNGTIGAVVIQEYGLPSVNGIHMVNLPSTDPFGGFQTIPNINGYQYVNSVCIGSTAITRSISTGIGGGYIRGIKYRINVPAGPPTLPYTMTYAYALVLENGTHNSINQPMFSATLTTNAGVIDCASPKYFLPTLNNSSDTVDLGATLDSALAISEGFHVSQQLSPNSNPNSANPNAPHLQDVWYKKWTEVTFDLGPYRGQQVTLTFEADNCVPGGHFSYAYIAIRNMCAGLLISGDSVACINNALIYSVPSLAGATYQWTVPPNWTIQAGGGTNIIKVLPSVQGGFIIAHEVNGCANLTDTIPVSTIPPTIPGSLGGSSTVCTGINASNLSLSGFRGTVVGWVYSTDGTDWSNTDVVGPNYTALNLNQTTEYRALVQNGSSCAVDSSSIATVVVDQKTIAGLLQPDTTNICQGQPINAQLNLVDELGSVQQWQVSTNGINWQSVNPPSTDSVYTVSGITSSSQYRAIVQNGVCPADTGTVAYVELLAALYPQASGGPADTTICYGYNAPLHDVVTVGTQYSWSNLSSLSGEGGGKISVTPEDIQALATPLSTTTYILTLQNTGCPNALLDSFHIKVIPPIIVQLVQDTNIVVGEPLQLRATTNDPTPDQYSWTPSFGLNNPSISDPVALLGAEPDSVRYSVKALEPASGCFGTASVLVRVFKTAPDIFVPNAFTPGLNINSVFRPIPVGISRLAYFRVYNRWGQLVYSSSAMGLGWDGTVNGIPQGTNSYVWMVEGTDYTGKVIRKKGTMVLIR